MAAPAISLTALDLRLTRLAAHDRRRRMTAHAIEAMTELAASGGYGTSKHPIDRIGNLVDELITEAETAGRVTRFWDGGPASAPRNAARKEVEAFELQLDGCPPGFAICLPTDADAVELPPWTCVNILSEAEYRRSAAGPRWQPRTTVTGANLAALQRVKPATAPSPVPSVQNPANVKQGIDITEGLDPGYALIEYRRGMARSSTAVPWGEAHERIAALVEDENVEPETIRLYRHTPIRVRRTVSVAIMAEEG